MFFAFVKSGRFFIAPLATSIVEMRVPSKYNDSRFASGPEPRSETNAMVLPSGEKAGCMSAYLSFVNRRTSFDSVSKRKRSETPVAWPAMQMVRLSGDHATFVMASMPGTRTLRKLRESTSTMPR